MRSSRGLVAFKPGAELISFLQDTADGAHSLEMTRSGLQKLPIGDALLPFAMQILLAVSVLELLGGLAILFGGERCGSAMLLLVLLPVTPLVHDFWAREGVDQKLEMAMFMKNLCITGACFLMLASRTVTKVKTS